MTVVEFLKGLRGIYPTIEIIEKDHTSNSFNDPILSLLNSHDLGNFEVGFISFFDSIYEHGDNVAFGSFIEDYIIIDIDSGEVKVIDLYDPEDVLHYCAQDTESFLELVLLYAEFEKLREGVKVSLEEKLGFINQAKMKTGGEKYMPFLKILYHYGNPYSLDRTVPEVKNT